MIAIILAGGYARRLWPLTKNKPKPLLPVAGKPLINYIMEKLLPLENIDKTIILTNSKFKKDFERWVEEWGFKNVEVVSDGSICEERA
jgi:glucose-1-phosphate thymidylyltransferase